MPWHDNLAAGRWMMMTFDEQLANIGSEVERAIRAFETGKQKRFEFAYERALELFDLSATDGRWRGSHRREVLRVREEFCDLFSASNPSDGSARRLSGYFLESAIAARQRRSLKPSSGDKKTAAQ